MEHRINPITHICLLLLVLIGSMQTSKAKNSDFYYYKKLGIKEGLSQSKVISILNDYRGSLWIGTEHGLNRYDNDLLKQYAHEPNKKNSLPSDYIYFIAEDSLLNLWIATKSGICLYNQRNDSFQQVNINQRKTLITSYLLLDDGVIFGGENCIYKFKYSTKQWETLYSKQQSNASINIKKMVHYDDRHILINISNLGIYLFDLQTYDLKKVEYFTDTNYNCIYIDSMNQLWISPYGKGLYCYQNNKMIKHYTTENSLLTNDVIYDIVEKDNQLWIATDGGGINILSLEDESFSHINRIQDDLKSFPTNAVCRIYRDPINNIWAGTPCNGLIGIKHVHANSYSDVPFDNPYGLSGTTVNRFFQDSDGMIWIGIDGGGINRYDPTTYTFKHYPMTQNDKITAITDFSPQELLVFSYNKGFYLFDKTSGLIRSSSHICKKMNEQIYTPGRAAYIQRISLNKIIISNEHVYIYDITENRVEKVAENEVDYYKCSPSIIASKNSKTYFIDFSNIYEYNLSNKKFRTIYCGEHTLNDACMDKEGNFWLASEEGLIYYNPISKKSKLIHTTLFNEITSVMADNHDKIWVGNRQNLYAYSIKKEKMIILDKTDGILPNEYISGSHILLQNGDIMIGGFTGMTHIDSHIHFDAEDTYKIELLEVLLNGLPIIPEQAHHNNVRTIEIPWNFTSLQLRTLLNSKDVFYKNIYRFNIKELNQELTRSHSNSFVVNYLPVGKYTITASYYTRDGEWSTKQSILHIIVTPPWWRTYWFYISVCIVSALLIYCIIYSLLRKRKTQQKREIMQLKNKMYEEKINFLTNISHELRTPLTLICAPLKRIIDLESEEKDIQKLISPIYRQAYHMKNIIDMVLDVRKLEEGKEALHILPHSLNEWVQTVGDKFIHEFTIKGIKLEYKLDPQITEVLFDKYKCEFVLSNFLMNALKFSEANTTTTIYTQLSEGQDWVKVAVADEGMGLSMVDTESLFANFYQGIHEKGGSGIGLSYAKSLITLHKGKIGAFNNTSNKGAIFYYQLPLSAKANGITNPTDVSQITEDKLQQKEKIDYAYLKKYSVIVIEDTSDLRNYLKKTLDNYFDRVYIAKDGKEGLEQTKRYLPDIIISDVMMPRMNGFELCRQVKTDLDISHIPLILLTAYYNSQNMSVGYKTGADAFLPKPFEIDSLLALSYNQLKLREQIRARYKEDQTITYKEVSFSNADESFLLKLNTLITDNMGNPELNVPFLANNMCISRSLLFKKVKAITGVGIIDYVNKLRVDKSIILMNTTSMSLSEISEFVGFSSLRYFSRVFKTVKGELPSAYRRNAVNQ